MNTRSIAIKTSTRYTSVRSLALTLAGFFTILGGTAQAVIFEDDFHRADLGLGTIWQEEVPVRFFGGGPRIVDNKYQVGPAGAGLAVVTAIGVTTPTDNFEINLTATVGYYVDVLSGIAFNVQDKSNYYELRAFTFSDSASAIRLQLVENVGGVENALAILDTTETFSPNAFYKFNLTSTGAGQFDFSLRDMTNTVLLSGSYTDTTPFVGGGVGIYSSVVNEVVPFNATYFSVVPEPSAVLLMSLAGGFILMCHFRNKNVA